ncbi:high-affinity branched-chain amino acid ABC transporter permease LivM [Geminicoccus flavidas]|uniref:high-affinity branched-chain amino acid ABC transporter permease LivM n=1 Tax=Geminicoccus flavidas TaxID=2506407 RepID=UPI001F27639C|nr:high-affinity branched-chain amino acid ABC transporter permease LivM [Geminicoccus flavidas]
MTGLLAGLDGNRLLRHVLGAVLITFLMTSLIVGLELVATQTGLSLRPRYHIVLYCVVVVALGSTAVFALAERSWRLPMLVGVVIAALLLVPLLTGNLASDLAFLLPFPVAPLNWLALLLPAFILIRAAQLAYASARPPAAAARRREMTRTGKLVSLGLGLLLILVAFAFPISPWGSRQLVDILTIVLIYIMLGWGLNIVVGLAGLLDLGYVAFYAVGAYSYALLSEYFGWSFWVCLPLAGLFAASFGIVLGFPVLRLRGDYLAIVTLGFGEIIRVVLINWYEFTGGPDGIGGIPRPSFFGLPFQANPPRDGGETFASFFGLSFDPYHRIAFLYYLILVLALFTNWFTIRIRKLPIGRAWEALREDEIACRALGLNPTNVKLAAFGIGAMFAGFAGSFFAARQGFISPESFVFIESAVILAIVVLGGLGSQLGIVFSAAILIGLPEFFRELEDYRMLAFGLVMVLIMIWKPTGLVSHRDPTIRLHPRGDGR